MSDTIQLSIKGMTCMHCVAAVEKALTAVDGVDEVMGLPAILSACADAETTLFI